MGGGAGLRDYLSRKLVAGAMQLCVGQIGGVEAAVHAVNSLFHLEETEVILLVDASNAF